MSIAPIQFNDVFEKERFLAFATDDSQVKSPSKTNFVKALATKKDLEKAVSMRRISIKIMGCCCLPISLCSFFCVESVRYENEGLYIDEKTKVPYSNWTICSAGTCWKPKLPPNNAGELLSSVFDPCLCCVCWTDESSDHYLLPPERQVMQTAEKIIGNIKFQMFVDEGKEKVVCDSNGYQITTKGIKNFKQNYLYDQHVVELIAGYVPINIAVNKPKYVPITHGSSSDFSYSRHRYGV